LNFPLYSEQDRRLKRQEIRVQHIEL